MILSTDIVKEWNLHGLPKEKQLETVEHVGRVLYQAILVRSLDILSDKDQEELDEILDQDETTPEDTLRFLQKRIPTFDKMFQEEKMSLKEGLLV